MLNRGVEGIESELFVKFLVGENYCELSQTQMIIEILAFLVILSHVKHVTMTSTRPVSHGHTRRHSSATWVVEGLDVFFALLSCLLRQPARYVTHCKLDVT